MSPDILQQAQADTAGPKFRAGLDPATMDVQSLYTAITVINHLAVELDVDLALESVRKCSRELLKCEKVTLFLINHGRQELRGKISDEPDGVIVVKFGEGIAGTIARNGGILNISDAYNHPLFNSEVDKRTQFRTRSILCCSIADTSGTNVAVLQALNKLSGPFTQADENLLQLFGVHLGNTLTKSCYYEEARREKLRLATLSSCFKQLSAVTSLNGALDTIATAAKELVSAQHTAVLLMDHPRQVLWTSIVDSKDTSKRPLSFRPSAEADPRLLQLFSKLSEGQGRLTDVLLQPVIDPSTDKCLAVLCALNKQAQSYSCSSLLFEQSFTTSDCDAVSLFSMEVADVLSARSLDVSFASAMSTVSADTSTAAQERMNNMLQAQLMDYAPPQLTNAAFGKTQSFQLRHSATLSAAARFSFDSGNGTSLSRGGDGPLGVIRRWSSIDPAECTRSQVSAAGSCATPIRQSLHYNMLVAIGPGSASTDDLRAKYATWDLDCAAMGPEKLAQTAYDLFMLSGVLNELQLPESVLSGFLSAVMANYHADVPYHNLGHVVQVLHTVWMILETTNARTVLSPAEELVLLVAAICHDLDHDGFTNIYHVNVQSELAQMYNDRSVQENHHCALTSQLLRQRGSNLLQCFTGPDWHQARRLLIDAILATDMHHHFALTQELQKHGLVYSTEDDAGRALLMKAILHTADLGNFIRPFPAALAAAERVHTEFQRQVARELELGLPVSAHMAAQEPAVWAKMEVQFIDYVAGPLWDRLGQVFPTLQQPISTMCVNRARFASMAQGSSKSVTSQPSQAGHPAMASATLFGSHTRRTTNSSVATAPVDNDGVAATMRTPASAPSNSGVQSGL
eukprot:GHUV01012289.1.p1 GENE.GHUV01012289.1~~GHUV01012289.1.p1  ORF type:complete len:856 (+),score=231.71 GHUV01012289.1:611-3178(+)